MLLSRCEHFLPDVYTDVNTDVYTDDCVHRCEHTDVYTDVYTGRQMCTTDVFIIFIKIEFAGYLCILWKLQKCEPLMCLASFS